MAVAERTLNFLVITVDASVKITYVTSTTTVEIIQMRPGHVKRLIVQVYLPSSVEMDTVYPQNGSVMAQMIAVMVQMRQIVVSIVCFVPYTYTM